MHSHQGRCRLHLAPEGGTRVGDNVKNLKLECPVSQQRRQCISDAFNRSWRSEFLLRDVELVAIFLVRTIVHWGFSGHVSTNTHKLNNLRRVKEVTLRTCVNDRNRGTVMKLFPQAKIFAVYTMPRCFKIGYTPCPCDDRSRGGQMQPERRQNRTPGPPPVAIGAGPWRGTWHRNRRANPR